MHQKRNPAIRAKICAMYGKRIKQDEYTALLQKNSLTEISVFLKNHPAYAKVMTEVDPVLVHREYLETVLQKSYFYDFLKLFHYLGKEDRSFLQIIILHFEIEEILWCLSHIIDENAEHTGFINSRYDYIDAYSELDFVKMAHCLTVEELIEVLRSTPYADILSALPKENGRLSFSAAEHSLWAYYYKEFFSRIKNHFSGKKRQEIYKIIGMETDVLNITMIARLRLTFGMDADEVRPFLMEQSHKLSADIINQLLLASDFEEFSKALERTPYRSILQSGKSMAQRLDEYLALTARRTIHFSEAPVALILSFLTIKSTELRNLKTIVEACRYNVPKDKISEKLIGL